jgi:hypothetical protein
MSLVDRIPRILSLSFPRPASKYEGQCGAPRTASLLQRAVAIVAAARIAVGWELAEAEVRRWEGTQDGAAIRRTTVTRDAALGGRRTVRVPVARDGLGCFSE